MSEGLEVVSISTVYVRSMYFALSTMSSLGYGDAPKAHTNVEHLFAMLTQVLGAVMAAAIFSNIAQLINKGDAPAQRFTEQTQQVNEFIRFHKLPLDLVRHTIHLPIRRDRKYAMAGSHAFIADTTRNHIAIT